MSRAKQLMNLSLPLVGIALALAAWWAASRAVTDFPSPLEQELFFALSMLAPSTSTASVQRRPQ